MGSVATPRATRRLFHAVMLVAPALLVVDIACATPLIIRFSPGPDFTTRVATPWGDYVIDQVGDNTVWVGTETEYVDRKVRTIEARHHFREIRPREFVDARLPALSVGTDDVAGISSAIALTPVHIPHAPPERDGHHYVLLSWSASGRERLTVRLEDLARRRIFAPFSCVRDSVPHCLWQLPDADLGVPLLIVFVAPHAKPAAAALPSIAYLEYQANKDMSPLGASDLAQLHNFDPRIPPRP